MRHAGHGFWKCQRAADVDQTQKADNVVMVLNGHFTGGAVAHRMDVADNGNLVNQMFTDMQTLPDGGNGWLETITFHPASNTISVQTYSPFLGQFMTGASQQFTVPYHNPHPQTGMGYIRGTVRNLSGCAPVSGTKVSAAGSTANTAADGTYQISVPPRHPKCFAQFTFFWAGSNRCE